MAAILKMDTNINLASTTAQTNHGIPHEFQMQQFNLCEHERESCRKRDAISLYMHIFSKC